MLYISEGLTLQYYSAITVLIYCLYRVNYLHYKKKGGNQDFYFTNIQYHWRRKWQPTPVFLPGESQGRGSLVGCRL